MTEYDCEHDRREKDRYCEHCQATLETGIREAKEMASMAQKSAAGKIPWVALAAFLVVTTAALGMFSALVDKSIKSEAAVSQLNQSIMSDTVSELKHTQKTILDKQAAMLTQQIINTKALDDLSNKIDVNEKNTKNRSDREHQDRINNP